ncbi:hypothetical protein NQ314_009423 [Rhamnusium bicolor]|uniref:GBD/FH3 domain-containing protein n=1 Tax=Rhamnusium bicolor TaxID=1586634 RepID=A0AAV8XZR8_9CUCU|nr:hypothetical protein NQ314_009423 [Rhamnusium bicolor]
MLLSKACEPPISGHSAVSEAMSTLRLRFGEPVRFRFLVGMLSSAGGQKELLTAGMRFINKFLDSAGTLQKRLYVQAELEQAGFDIAIIKRNIGNTVNTSDPIFGELSHWEKSRIDVEGLTARLENAEKDNDNLRDKILLLERRVQILQEEKGILISLEQCLKERCSELQGEGGSTPEDEGISSSERSLTPEEDMQQESSVYELYSLQSETLPMKTTKPQVEEEEETTIEEVIEELRNIINDAETEAYNKEELKLAEERKRIEEAQVAAKVRMHVDIDDYAIANECEIVPSNLHPQPPRRARSLVHLFIPAEDYDYCNKELFFENETAFTSEEGSDSLLSASKCHLPRLEKELVTPQAEVDNKTRKLCKRTPSKTSIKRAESFKQLPKTFTGKHNNYDDSHYNNTPATVCQQKEKQRIIQELTNHRIKCKSLDRIDDGLDTLVDIVVTNQREEKTCQFRSKSDSGNVMGGTSLCRSISNVFISPKREVRSRLSTHSEEKQKMFLPAQRDHGEVPYYFPRVQEKRNSSSTSFLIKRGHTNAGLYSGQIVVNNHINVLTTKVQEFASSKLSGKVTDLPSGLY